MCDRPNEGGRCETHLFSDLRKNQERIRVYEEKVAHNKAIAEKVARHEQLSDDEQPVVIRRVDELNYEKNVATREELNYNYSVVSIGKGATARADIAYYRKKALGVAVLSKGVLNPNKTSFTLEEQRLSEVAAKLNADPDYQLSAAEAALADSYYEDPAFTKTINRFVAEKNGREVKDGYLRAKTLADHYDSIVQPVENFTRQETAYNTLAALRADERQFAILEDPEASDEDINSLTPEYRGWKDSPQHYEGLKSHARLYGVVAADPAKMEEAQRAVRRLADLTAEHALREEQRKQGNKRQAEERQAKKAAEKKGTVTLPASTQHATPTPRTHPVSDNASNAALVSGAKDLAANKPKPVTPAPVLPASIAPAVKNPATTPAVKAAPVAPVVKVPVAPVAPAVKKPVLPTVKPAPVAPAVKPPQKPVFPPRPQTVAAKTAPVLVPQPKAPQPEQREQDTRGVMEKELDAMAPKKKVGWIDRLLGIK